MLRMDFVIGALQLVFMFTSFTVERAYCRAPLSDSDSTPLVQQTIVFCTQYNQLFLERPEWLVQATCIHANYSWMLYTLILVTAATASWHNRLLQKLILLGLGAKLYAVLFYHYMEFTSHLPPPNPVAYFGAEGAYMVSIALVLYKTLSADPLPTTTAFSAKKAA
jgi:hypothetical protein